MFPLKIKKLIRGCDEHIAAGLGCGADFQANYEPLYAPFDGAIFIFNESGGGNWTRLTRPNGDQIEFAHLNQRLVTIGFAKAGTVIAITGNTGTITTGPHLHLQIKRDGQRLDPEKYNWEDQFMYENKIIRNEKDGSYAYVLAGTRREIKAERAGFASLTAIQRKSEVVNVTDQVYQSIPKGVDF